MKIYSIPGLVGIFICLIAIVLLINVVYRGYILYKKEKRQSVELKTLIILFTTTIFVELSVLFNRTMYTFFEVPSPTALAINETINLLIGVVNATYSLIFVVRAFSVHPKEWLLSFTYYFLGFAIGMTALQNFSTNPEIRTIMIVVVGQFILFVSFIAIIYAFISANRQKIPLVKASMKYYGYASLFFLVALFIGVFGDLMAISDELTLDNILRIGQIFHAYLTYCAFFKPNWFRKRYGKEDTYIERMFKNVKIK